MFDTPILFIIFNRPVVTELVFNEIRKAKPKQLFIAADGPRKNKPADADLCAKTRAIVANIDWPCEVKTLYREENLGCGKAVSGAITWFFENVEQGIILEDDCLPNQSFFMYCQDLLEVYKNDPKIMHIGGVNFQNKQQRGAGSYYFSAIPHVWGWASWRRAWKKYNFTISDFYLFNRENKIYNYFENEKLAQHWLNIFKNSYYHKIDTWDHQWTFAIMNNGGMSILPNTNLVSNLGFDETATHTNLLIPVIANSVTHPMKMPLAHPNKTELSKEADFYFYREVEKLPIGEKPEMVNKIRSFISRVIEYGLREFFYKPKIKHPANNILVQKIDAVGDFLLFRNFIKTLVETEKYWNYKFYLLANIRLKSFIEETDKKWFAGVLYFDPNDLKKIRSKYRFYSSLRKLKLNTIIHPTFSRTSVTDDIILHAGAPNNIGFLGDTSNILATNKSVTDLYYSQLIDVDAIAQDKYTHEFEKNKLFFETLLGEKINLARPSLTDLVTPVKEQCICVCPGSNEEYKLWDTTRFAELINNIAKEYPGYTFKVLCGPCENSLGSKILAAINREILNKVQQVNTGSILELIQYISHSALTIANDSAPVHICVALNIPVVCIFNGTKYNRFVPYPKSANASDIIVLPEEVELHKNNPGFTQKLYSVISNYSINSIEVVDVFNAVKKGLDNLKHH